MRRLYVAGPMTGVPQFNFPAFDAAAADLRGRGYEVVSPAEIDDEETRAAALASPDGAPGSGAANGETWGDFLARDVKLIADQVDAVVVMDGWQDSRGARLETFVARLCDKPILRYPSLAPVSQLELRVTHADFHGLRDPSPPPEPKRTILGLTGLAGAGKDTVAAVLVDNHGWTRVAFADALKAVAYDLNPTVHGTVLQPMVDNMGWDWVKRHMGEVRPLLQRLGVACRDHIDPDVWVKAAMRKVDEAEGNVVITDLRFPNEVEAVKDAGGIVGFVDRPGLERVNDHVSEQLAVDHGWGWVSDVVFANHGTIEDLARTVPQDLGL